MRPEIMNPLDERSTSDRLGGHGQRLPKCRAYEFTRADPLSLGRGFNLRSKGVLHFNLRDHPIFGTSNSLQMSRTSRLSNSRAGGPQPSAASPYSCKSNVFSLLARASTRVLRGV